MSKETRLPILYGAPWCSYCVALKNKLAAMGVSIDYRNVDELGVREEMNAKTDGNQTIPVLFNRKDYKINPNDGEVRELLMSEENKKADTVQDVIMIGAGPTSLAAAVYTSREDIDTLLFEKGIIGGLAAITDMVDNYPGFEEGIEGMQLADKLQKQAERFGAKIELGEVQSIAKVDDTFVLQTTSGEKRAKAVLIGTGSEWKKLGVPGEKEFYGRGVHNCATCDGAFYRDKKLVVVGGGNSSAQEALFLTKFASHIDILIRGTAWKASDVLIKEIEKNPKITVHFETVATEIVGGDVDGMNKVTGVNIEVKGKKSTIVTDGVFVFIGLLPVTYYLEGSGVEFDDFGFVKTDKKLMTAVPGMFCAGDVRSGATMQIASAVGEGASAALSIREYLENYDRERMPNGK
jgi:thioredoxin reductase (NADPH)